MCYGNTVNPQPNKSTSIYIRAMLCDSNFNEIYQSDVRPVRVYFCLMGAAILVNSPNCAMRCFSLHLLRTGSRRTRWSSRLLMIASITRLLPNERFRMRAVESNMIEAAQKTWYCLHCYNRDYLIYKRILYQGNSSEK